MKRFFLLCIAALAMFSCRKEPVLSLPSAGEMIPFSVNISSCNSTKAFLDGLSVKWSADDVFGVFDGVYSDPGGIRFSVNTVNGTSCTLSGQISESADGPLYFLYPYQRYVATVGKSANYVTALQGTDIFPVDAPFRYASAPDYLPPKSLMMVGKMENKNSDRVIMKTPMAFVKFTLEDDSHHPVTRIQFCSQGSDPLAGTYTLDMSGDDPIIRIQENPSLSSTQQKVAYDITITPKDGSSFAAGDYYFAIPPGTYAKGIRLKFWDDAGKVAEKYSDNPLSVGRAVIKNLGRIEPSALSWYEAIDLCFLEAVLQKPSSSPFNEAIPSSFSPGTVYSFTYGDDADEFKFCSVKAGGYWNQTGVNILGTNSYYEIPGRSGKKIHKISIRVGAQGAKCGNPVIVDVSGADGSGRYNTLKLDRGFDWLDDSSSSNELKDAWWGSKQYATQKDWVDFEQHEGQSFRIRCTENQDYLKLMNLCVQYVDVDSEPIVEPSPVVKTISAETASMLYTDNIRCSLPCAKDPTVIRWGKYYYLYYSQPPYDEDRKPEDLNPALAGWHCAVAKSSDLVNWTRVGDLDIRSTGGKVLGSDAAPCVKIFDGVIHLFYQRYWSETSNNAIWHATSEDGVHFRNVCDKPVFYPSNTWAIPRAIDAEVYRVKDKMILMYATRDASTGKVQMIGMAEAPYGSMYGPNDWTEITVDEPLLKPDFSWEGKCVEAPTVLERDGVWYLFYAGSYNHQYQQIGLATSIDGYHFTRVSYKNGNPGLFYEKGPSGSWNQCESGHPGIFEDEDGNVYLFYQGKPTIEGTDSNYSLSMLRLIFI